MKRIYGNEKTNLTLTEKAYQIYSDTDPLRIVEEEYEDENGEKKNIVTLLQLFSETNL